MDIVNPLPSSYSSSPNSPRTRTCLCSPTNHPGSFRCILHKNKIPRQQELVSAAKSLTLRSFLLQIINPSKNNLKQRRNFQPKPSRFCVVNGNGAGGVTTVS
ncbi:hypothetical protein LINPERPRIM_LOCUS30808 [Linum perenne]